MVLRKYYDGKSAAIWWKISIDMVRFQQIVPSQSPFQPPHLLQFDTLMFPYRNEKLTCVIIFQFVCQLCYNLWGTMRFPVNLTTLNYSLQNDRLCRHDIFQNFYTIDVWGQQIYAKTTLITTMANSWENSVNAICVNSNMNNTLCEKEAQHFAQYV